MIDLSVLVGIQPKKAISKHGIYLNEKTKFDIGNEQVPIHYALIGQTGGGKTFGAFIVMNQYPAALFFDYKGHAKKTIHEQKESKHWKIFHVYQNPTKKTNAFKVNIRDIGSFGIKTFIPKTRKELRIKMALYKFFQLPTNHPFKCWKGFAQTILNAGGNDELLDEFSIVFSKTDKGISMKELMNQKTIVETMEYPVEYRSLGLVIGGLFDVRNKVHSTVHNKFLVGVDECDTFAQSSHSIGKGMGFVYSFGRSYNLSGLVAGTTEGDLHKQIKANITCFLIFETRQEAQKFSSKYGIYLNQDDFRVLESRYGLHGNCVVKADGLGIPAQLTHLNMYYQVIRSGKIVDQEAPRYMVPEYLSTLFS